MKKVHVIPASLNKRLISTLMSNRKVDHNKSKTFALKSTVEFTARSANVFGSLQSLEESHKTWVAKNDTIECFEESEEPAIPKPHLGSSEKFVRTDESTKQEESNVLKSKISASEVLPCKNPGEEPVFKKPLPVKNWKRKSSDSQKRLKKWTKYSLEDVPVSSEAANTAIAFQFLDELRSRKEENVETGNDEEKIVFKKPKRKELKAPGSVKTRVPVATETSESCKEKKQVLGELKPSTGNITLAHLQDE